MSLDPLDPNNKQPDAPQAPDEVGRLEKLNQKLYSPNTQFQIRNRKKLRRDVPTLEDEWNPEKGKAFTQVIKERSFKFSVFAKIALIAFIFFLGSAGYAYYIFNQNQENDFANDVELTVVGPVSIGGGEELTLDIIVENKGTLPIQTVDAIIEYPEGTKSSEDLRTELPRYREVLGDIQPNSFVKEDFRAALFGQEGDRKEIKVRIEYRLPGTTAIFDVEKTFVLALQSSPIRLAIDSVKELTSGQETEFEVTLASNANQDLQNVVLEAEYPFGFRFSSADIDPTVDDNVWFFSELEPQDEIKFKVRGVLEGQDLEKRFFRWSSGIADVNDANTIGVRFTRIEKPITIIKPFLALEVSLDSSFENDLVKKGAEEIEGRVTYKNNTGAPILDAEIILKLNGEVIADERVDVGRGFFDSTDNSIIWNKTTDEIFKQVPVGLEENLLFKFQTKPLATRNAVYKNPEIRIDAFVKGNRVSETGVSEALEVTTVKRIKIESDVALKTITSYDGEPFANTGPIPPQVETPTTYTITLDISNSSNYVERGRVIATLPEYVRWNNRVVPASEEIVFDPVNRNLIWNVGDLVEHLGYIDPSRTASVQLTLVPSASQLGEAPPLFLNPRFEGYDTFTKTNIISKSEKAPSTDIGRGANLNDAKIVEKDF